METVAIAALLLHVSRFLTSADITLHAVLIHDYYSRLDPNAIFVTIDTGLTSGRLEVKAHIKYATLISPRYYPDLPSLLP